MSASISATTGSYRLELGGQSLSVNAIAGGGAVGVLISGPPTGGAPFREKHLAGLRYEPIAIAASFGSARPLFDLVRSAWLGMPPQSNGAVMRVVANGRPVSRREFVKAVLAETIIPNLDGSSNSPAYVTVRLAPEITRDVTPPATLPPAGPAPPASLSSNFRLATMLVTRAEEWCVEAESVEKARELLAAGLGHRCHLGDRLHFEVEGIEDE